MPGRLSLPLRALRHVAFVSGSGNKLSLPLRRVYVDVLDGGPGQIHDSVDKLGVLGAYRVRLLERNSSRIVRETWSDDTGAYQFNGIALRHQGYTLIAYDHGPDPVNAAISDRVTPELPT